MGLESEYLVILSRQGFFRFLFLMYLAFVLASIMGRSKWHELKARYNVAEIEVPDPLEEEVAPLETCQKIKRGEKEVGGTSTPQDTGEVTSKAVNADAIDLTGSPPPEGTSSRAVAKEVAREAQAGPVPTSVEVRVEPSSEVPRPDISATIQAAPTSTPAEACREGSSSGAPSLTPATAAPPQPQLGAPKGKCIIQRFDVTCPLARLDHVSMSSDFDSMWSTRMTIEAFYSRGSLRSANKAIIEKVGPVEGLDSTEVFMQRSITIVDYWKRKWSKMQGELKSARSRVQPLEEENQALGVALSEAVKKNEAELQATRRDLTRTQKSLEIALRANEVYASQVGKLQEIANSSRGRVRSLEDEVSGLKADLAEAAKRRLYDEVLLAGKEEEASALKADLDQLVAAKTALERRLVETERAILLEHKKGFVKAARQARLLAPVVDLSTMHIEKEVRAGRLVKEDDLPDS
ncbi:uncharacterized protein LOC109812746 [Cajanus cajan]|uniref:uncharacterized protein LOC109812746 n=1 Tax=Cajanus cajan TaxID=3821 RepID=UPI00098DC214|nr:uncharacterized protein LOC109812746 [Cajanus cajan]